MTIEEDFWAELAQIQAESIGWIPLDEGAYLHVGFDEPVIQVVGIAKVEMAGSNVLWLTWGGIDSIRLASKSQRLRLLWPNSSVN